MIRVGWLADRPDYTGGAELTQAEFRKGASEEVEIVECPPGQVDAKCDVYAVHNCVSYSLKDLKRLGSRPALKYWNDVGTWYSQGMRDWFAQHSVQVCCSRLQARHMGFGENNKLALIPPPLNLEPFSQAAASVNGNRARTVCVAQWQNPYKGANAVAEWAEENATTVDFYGGGTCAPTGSKEVAYQAMPSLLAQYERFVFLPQAIEPFGRLVAEAWAAGCEIVCNRMVGAVEWLKHDPDAIGHASEDYWRLLLEDSLKPDGYW